MEAKKNNSMSVISMLISLALFIIAFLAWNRNKQLFGAEKRIVLTQPAKMPSSMAFVRSAATLSSWVVPPRPLPD